MIWGINMAISESEIVYPPEIVELNPNFDVDCRAGELFENNPNELSPFELQYIKEYSIRDIEESLFYEQGELI